MLDARGKEIIHEDKDSVKSRFKVRPRDIADAMHAHEVPDDVRYLVALIAQLCAP